MKLYFSSLSAAKSFLEIHYRPTVDHLYLHPCALAYGETAQQLLEHQEALPLAVGDIAFTKCRLLIRNQKQHISEAILPASMLINLAELYPRIATLLDRITSRYLLQKKYHLPQRSVMGILNATPDSFSDGGQYLETDRAYQKAVSLIEAGADIIDVGGESTRPNALPVSLEEEKRRTLPLLKKLAPLCRQKNVLLSIDTRNAALMQDALSVGVHLLNDVSALTHDPHSPEVAARSNALICLMHMQGTPETMQENPSYCHSVLDIFDYLETRIHALREHHIPMTRIIADPGIGFGKTDADNLKLLSWTSLFLGLGVPLLYGTSRKSFIGRLTQTESPTDRLAGSLITALKSFELGASFCRVHDVSETKQALKMCDFLMESS